MRDIYQSRDRRDYGGRIFLLDEKLKPEIVLHTKEGICEYDVYHLSNGVTLWRITTHYSNGDEFRMIAFGDRRKVSQVEKLVTKPLPKSK